LVKEVSVNITSEGLREQIIKMGAVVEAALEMAVDLKSDSSKLYALEDEVNRYHLAIDDACFKYIALKQPHARDLRIALSVMKMNSELERMGDQAVNIRRYFKRVTQFYPRLKLMNDLVRRMVRHALDAFVHNNTNLATDVIKADADVNDLNREIVEVFLQRMKNNEIPFEEGFSVIRVAKNLERVGDHSTNLAEDVIFLVSGADIRHNISLKGLKKGANKETLEKTDSEE
jgi:phosphate transport system protein